MVLALNWNQSSIESQHCRGAREALDIHIAMANLVKTVGICPLGEIDGRGKEVHG
jgi:hypothetical protein